MHDVVIRGLEKTTAFGAGTVTQPDALPSNTGDAALSADQALTGGRVVQSTSGSESDDDQHSETGSLLEGNF